MSKAHDPHWRYVAFRMDAATKLSRKGLSQALARHFRKLTWPEPDHPKLTRFEWPHAIVRVHHYRMAETRSQLEAMTQAMEAAAPVTIKVATLSSSGTLKALTERLGILGRRT